MPSPRSTTAMRPSTPLSPRFESSSRPCSRGQQAYQPRSPSAAHTARRAYGQNLTLPGLPRFHPANYPSAHSSLVATPTSGAGSPHAPISPGLQQKFHLETQRQFLAHQRDHLSRPASGLLDRPDSPRLDPLGSPGPVTPLELESTEGYLAAGMSPSRSVLAENPAELADKLALAARQREKQATISAPTLGRSR